MSAARIIDEARVEGFDAYRAGVPETANPYDRTGDEGRAISWSTGFAEARARAAGGFT